MDQFIIILTYAKEKKMIYSHNLFLDKQVDVLDCELNPFQG